MKNLLLSTLIITASTLPFTVNAQDNSMGGFYIVAEAGITKNTFKPAGVFSDLTEDNNIGGSYGASLGYRIFTKSDFLIGIEGNFANSGGSSRIEYDGINIDIESDYVYGGHLALGGRIGSKKNIFVYGLLGYQGVKTANTASTDIDTTIAKAGQTVDGFSLGIAVETELEGNFGIRLKVLHNLYEGGGDGSKLRDTSLMAGLVLNF